MAIKVSNNKRFYWWFKSILILAILLTSLTHTGSAEDPSIVDQLSISQIQKFEIIEEDKYQFDFINSAEITSSPSVIDPTSKNPSSYSKITVKVTNQTGSPVSGVALQLTSTGGNIGAKSGTTDSFGKFTTTFNSSRSGTFLVNVSGVFSTRSVLIKVTNYPPKATFSVPPSNSAAPLTVTFDASGSSDIDGTIESYSWDFGDGTSGSGETATHIYQSAGEFTPSLTVTDNLGAINKFTPSSTIIVTEPSSDSLNVLMFSEPASVEPEKTSTITVVVKGPDGEEISGASVSLGINGKGSVNPTSGTTDPFGKFTSTFTASSEGKATIRAIVNKDDFNEGSNEINIEVKQQSKDEFNDSSDETNIGISSASEFANILVTSEPASVEPDKTSTITVTVKGPDGEEISGANISLDVNGNGRVNPSSGTTNSFGKFTSTFTASSEGEATIRATVSKDGFDYGSGETNVEVKNKMSLLIPVLFLVVLGILIVAVKSRKKIDKPETKIDLPEVEVKSNEAGLDIQIEPSSIPADGKSSAKITIRIKDEKGNFIPSQNEKIVELSTTLGAITSPVKIPSEAKAGIATITSGQMAGTAKVVASSDSLKGEGQVVFVELPKRYCMHCGTTMKMDAPSCPACEKIPPSGVDTKQCATCGVVLPQSAKFCDSCGARQPM